MADNSPLVVAIIVNYNGRDLLLDALESLSSSSYAPLKIVVVDNNSRDGSGQMVREQYPESTLIENSCNLGFALGCNQGLAVAADMKAKYVLFINSDATVGADTVRILVNHLELHERACAAAPYIFYYDDKDIIWYGGGKVALWRGWVGHNFIRKTFKQEKYKSEITDYLTGCIFLADTVVLSEAGGFSPAYGLYSEDVDLSLRLRNDDWELWVVPEAKGYHRVSATAGGELSPFKAFYRGRSSVQLFRDHAKPWEIPTLIVGGAVGSLLITVKLLSKLKADTVLAMWHGILNGILGSSIPKKYRLKD